MHLRVSLCGSVSVVESTPYLGSRHPTIADLFIVDEFGLLEELVDHLYVWDFWFGYGKHQYYIML